MTVKKKIAQELKRKKNKIVEEISKLEVAKAILKNDNSKLNKEIKSKINEIDILNEDMSETSKKTEEYKKTIQELSKESNELLESMKVETSKKRVDNLVSLGRRFGGEKAYLSIRNGKNAKFYDYNGSPLEASESLMSNAKLLTNSTVKLVGEMVKDIYYVNDILKLGDSSLEDKTYSERNKILRQFKYNNNIKMLPPIIVNNRDDAENLIFTLTKLGNTKSIAIKNMSWEPEKEVILNIKEGSRLVIEELDDHNETGGKLSNERANLRPANSNNRFERCKSCRFFGNPDKCKIVEGPVNKDLVCDWIQSRGVKEVEDNPYKVDDKDWVAFGKGMIKKQPYSHKVIDATITPEGPVVLIEDSAKPPHRFSLDKEFHIGHTNFEHHWTQEEVDALIRIGSQGTHNTHELAGETTTTSPNLPETQGTIFIKKKKKDEIELQENITEKGKLRVQSILFDKKKFTRKQALAWSKEHQFKSNTSRETDKFFRIRQISPNKIADDTFVTKNIKEDGSIKVVLGKLKKG